MPSQIFHKLKTISLWHFVWIAIVLSEIFTSIMSVILHGKVTYDYLVTGGIVSLFAAFIVIYSIKKMRETEKNLTEEIRKYHENLEDMVKERTTDLAMANEFLLIEIEERKQIEKRLQESEKQYRLLAENATDVIWTMDMAMRYTYISPSVTHLLGYSVEEAMALKLNEVLSASSFEVALKTFAEEIAVETSKRRDSSASRTLELEHLRKDGSIIWIEAKMTFLRDENRRPVGILGVTRDIADRKKMEQDIIKAQKLESLAILAGGIAHDFNNAMTGILGNISFAKMLASPDDKIVKRLLAAEKATLRAQNLTQQLLTFSRGGTPIKKVTAIAELIEEATDFALRGANVRCEYSIAKDLWPVEIDEGQISQVINNLVINAVQAMPEGGIIQVKAENMIADVSSLPLKGGRYLKISFEDQGIGIPEEHLTKIFDPYFTTKQKGSGLGLATAYSIIKKHDGHISVESKLGSGTIFYIYIPASAKELHKKTTIEESFIFGKGKILVMDDEEIVKDVAGQILTHLGYDVTCSSEGSETIEIYKKGKESEQPFDAVILDLTISGGMGGKKTIEKLLEMDPGIKAIASSGYSHDPIMSEFEKYGFKGVITKPYKADALSRVLHKIIAE